MNPKLKELQDLQSKKAKEALDLIKTIKDAKRDATPEENTRIETLTKEAEAAKAGAERMIKAIEEERKLMDLAAPKPTAGLSFPDADKRMEFKGGLGEWMGAIANRCKGNRIVDQRLDYWQEKIIADANETRANGMYLNSPQDGGFFVVPKFYEEILGKTPDLVSRILVEMCRRFPDNGAGIEIPRLNESSRVAGSRGGALQAYRKAEAASMTAATAKLGQLKLTSEELSFLLPVSNKMLFNAPALTEQVKQLVVPELFHACLYEIIRGFGAGQCLGIINAPCYVAVSKETGQKADTILYENIINMQQRLDVGCQMNAVWLINQFCVSQLRKLTLAVGTGGAVMPLWKYNEFGPGIHGLDGRKAFLTEQNPKLGDAGDIILADLSQYVMLFDPRVNAEASAHVYFVSNESAFRWVWEVNGAPAWAAYKTAEDGTNTISPFIGLEAR